jgi:hypothetical protein
VEQFTLVAIVALRGKVSGMNLPPAKDERRAVPRHIRDGEHDMLEETSSFSEGGAPARRARIWLYLAAVAALGIGIWFFLG